MASNQKVGSHKTTIFTDDSGFINVVYHSTPVVKFNDQKIILDTGGWYSNTTKLRMNQASNQFNLGYRVFQKKGKWFISFPDKTIDFVDKAVIDRE